MKKAIGIIILGFLICSNSFAEIIFKNCDLSPNFGKTDFIVFLEKNEIELRHENGDIRIFAIEKTEGSNVYAERIIANPTDGEIQAWSKDRKTSFFNMINDNVDENFLLNYNNGYVRAILTTHNGADQIFIDMFKEAKEKIETNCKVVNLYQKQEDTASTSSSTQDQQYESTAEFASVKKDKFYYKYKKKFMRMPESVLCISYINEYGWHKREKKQAIKFEVLETRGINCDPYMETAYYDKEKRDKEFRDAAKDAFDAGVGAAYGVPDSDSRANKKTRRTCIVQKVGKNLYKQTCR
mgnify:CR=1 FL=1|jgi:hypothetical protein